MIPVQLKLSGFLSYAQEAVLDFTRFDLACISGPNGAGKSSLLDAITWALFGRARRSDEGVIHMHSDAALVEFEFEYEKDRYRVVRVKHRNRPMRLELSRWDGHAWRPETGNTLRETQARLEALLRMDYNTFVQASFFLQGQADRFAQQTPARRKETLAQILGLGVWEDYRERARHHRRTWETRIEETTRHLHHLQEEVDRAGEWEAQLEATQQELMATQEELREAEALLRQWQAREGEIQAHRQVVAQLRRAWEEARQEVERLERQIEERQRERATLEERLAREAEVRRAYQDLQKAREELERWETLAPEARRLRETRQHLLARLREEKARLEARRQALEREYRQAQKRARGLERLREERETWREQMNEVEAEWSRLQDVETRLERVRRELEALQAERQRLRTLREALAGRRATLQQSQGGTCPVCQQPLPEARREALLRHLEEEDRTLQHQEQEIQERIRARETRLAELERHARRARDLDRRRAALQAKGKALEESIAQQEAEQARWEQEGLPQWTQVRRLLDDEAYLPEVRRELERIEARLRDLGYDEAAHARAREAVQRLQNVEAELREMEQDRVRLEMLAHEIARLEAEKAAARARLQEREAAYREAQARLEAMTQDVPDLTRLHRRVLALRERESQLLTRRGALQQRLELLQRYREEAEALQKQLQEMQRRVAQYRDLEEAFGRNGVPALLIEQALPQLEMEINRLLERLTDGEMRVYFRTQRPYRSRKDALKETLDIVVSDRYGERPYETFSGGEAFRINFAIRLALSRLLAHRAGARLRFLVIDEGFGSQDRLGRERLVEAIQTVRNEFAKILVITHLEDMKERFPVRIEVSKGPMGSRLQIVEGA